MFAVIITTMMWSAAGQEMILPPPVERLKAGMAIADVAKLLNETEQNVVWFGAIGFADITCDYPKSRVEAVYGADFRLKSFTRMPEPKKKPPRRCSRRQ